MSKFLWFLLCMFLFVPNNLFVFILFLFFLSYEHLYYLLSNFVCSFLHMATMSFMGGQLLRRNCSLKKIFRENPFKTAQTPAKNHPKTQPKTHPPRKRFGAMVFFGPGAVVVAFALEANRSICSARREWAGDSFWSRLGGFWSVFFFFLILSFFFFFLN